MKYDDLESYSQWGDDRLVWKYFSERTDGVFLEAGANHPTNLSQTWLLEKRGWSGVLVEPNPECCHQLRKERPGSMIFQKAIGSPGQRGVLKLVIPQGNSELAYAPGENQKIQNGDVVFEAELMTLTEVLVNAGITHLHLLSLDLEGMELEALEGLDFKTFKPDLVIVEDRLENLDLHRFLRNSGGYKLVRRNGSNNWYVPITHHFNVSMTTNLSLFRKLYLAMPFRRLRDFSRGIRGRNKGPHGR
jgi:FkbM family methyltransferase